MTLILIYSLVLLILLMGAQIWRPHLLFRLARRAYLISVFFVLFVALYLSYQQYQVWQASPVAKLLLPPHQPIGYFIQYAITHFWTNFMIALAISLLGLAAAKLLNKYFQERFFLPEEPWLFATAMLLVGHPGWMYYAVGLIAPALLIFSFQFLIFKRRGIRLSFYWLWLSAAILAIIILKAINLN